jgi:hypothetical protein
MDGCRVAQRSYDLRSTSQEAVGSSVSRSSRTFDVAEDAKRGSETCRTGNPCRCQRETLLRIWVSSVLCWLILELLRSSPVIQEQSTIINNNRRTDRRVVPGLWTPDGGPPTPAALHARLSSTQRQVPDPKKRDRTRRQLLFSASARLGHLLASRPFGHIELSFALWNAR